jgi:DNA-binding MarR family transcriptional regulator
VAGEQLSEQQPLAEAVDAVLTASRTLVAIATRSLGAAAEETSIAQYRALVVLASRGPQRMTDLSAALGVAPSTAGRMCDRLIRKELIRRYRSRSDRRSVLVSITPSGRAVVDQATERRRELIAGILAKLPPASQRAAADALNAFAEAAGEIPDSQWRDEPGEDAGRADAEAGPATPRLQRLSAPAAGRRPGRGNDATRGEAGRRAPAPASRLRPAGTSGPQPGPAHITQPKVSRAPE